MPRRRKAPSYSIFVRFRNTRLTMQRNIPSLEEAVACATALRATRFHAPDSVFIVREPGSMLVDEAALPRAGGSSEAALAALLAQHAEATQAELGATAHTLDRVQQFQARLAALTESAPPNPAAEGFLPSQFERARHATALLHEQADRLTRALERALRLLDPVLTDDRTPLAVGAGRTRGEELEAIDTRSQVADALHERHATEQA